MINVLIVVDVQNDFCEGGTLAVQGGADVARDITQYIKSDGDEYDFIIATRDTHDPDSDNGGHFSDDPDYIDSWPPHCVEGTDGANFHPNLVLPERTLIFDKGYGAPSYSGFEGYFVNILSIHTFLTALSYPDNIQLDIVGIATDHCVKATALDAVEFGYNTAVLIDLTVGVSPQSVSAALSAMAAAGVDLI